MSFKRTNGFHHGAYATGTTLEGQLEENAQEGTLNGKNV